MTVSRIHGIGLAAMFIAAGLMLAEVSYGEQAVSRAITLQSSGDVAAPIDQAEGRAFSLQNAGPVNGPLDGAMGRLFTLQNAGEEAGPPDEALARVWTLVNTGEAAPPPSTALARLFTAMNLEPGVVAAYPSNRAFTAFNLPVGGPPAGEASVARAFTMRQAPIDMAPPVSEAFARAVTLQNLGYLDEPGIDEVVGRPFTIQNAGDVVDIPVTLGEHLPTAFQLYANTPNPFRHNTTIRYDLPRSSPINIRVYDVAGRLVKILVHSKKHEPGRFVVDWNGRDQNGRSLASGVYFYRMRADSFEQNQRLVLVKD